GGSTAVDCSDLQADDFDAYPTTDDALRALHQSISDLAAACSNKVGAYLQQLGSMNVVRDMDEIRRAMGEDKLNFIGYSYGTRLAGLYLQTYPQHSGRIVLDGSVLPDSALTPLVTESLPAMQSNLRLFLSQCTNTDPGCSVDQLIARLTDRVEALRNDNNDASQVEFDVLGELVVLSTQEPDFGLFAADAVIEYLNSYDVAVLERFTQLLDALDEDMDDDDSDSETAQTAVMCADDAYRPTADDLITLLAQMNNLSDPFAEAQIGLAGLCAGWPQAVEPLAPIATSTAPLSIVIGGTTDAQTPVQWSETMAQAIGGTYIRSEHTGHTVVFTDQSECVDDLVEQFLLDGLAPTVTQCN
ncbi:MAG: alpha/beta fold hydrolase, partial [Pseudomonadota bacterium]